MEIEIANMKKEQDKNPEQAKNATNIFNKSYWDSVFSASSLTSKDKVTDTGASSHTFQDINQFDFL